MNAAYHGINGLGTWTLYKRETWRFLKVWNQTIIAPIVTTLLFLAVLLLALGGHARLVGGITYEQFIAPGLITMAVVQNAFANTSSSLMLSKIQGVIVDLLMPPLSPGEITFSLLMGGITRGVLVGIAVGAAVYLFVPATLHSFWLLLYYVFAASMMLSLLGIFTGVWSQSFDQVAAITNYIITPMAFLSGTFYSVHDLPEFWRNLCHWNPFFYMIDGMRYAITGHADGNVSVGVAVLLAVNALLWCGCLWIIRTGYRLKS